MRIAKLATVLFALFSLIHVSYADARKVSRRPVARTNVNKDGRWARPKVVKYLKARNLTTKIRVHSVRKSRSGRSLQLAVANKRGGKVKVYNVSLRTGRVSRTRTGLVKQSTARGKANLKLRRERNGKHGAGTFSGVNSSGLSRSGKSHRINSNTDANERAYINLRNGQLRRYDRNLK